MKKVFLLIIFLNSIIYANDTNVLLNEIKTLREDINKRFEATQNNMDKRFETAQNNMDKKFEVIFTILYILMALTFASPFIAIYLRDKREENDKKQFDKLKGVIFALREMAEDNEKLAKSLRAANI